MPNVRINFSKATEFETIPEGAYPIEVEETEIRPGSGEYPYINCKLRVVSGEYARRVLWLILSLSPKAFNTRPNLRALGFDIPDGDVDFDLDSDDLVGRQAIATVFHEPYNDTVTEKIDVLAPMTAGAGRKGGMR